jgi:hypothetical protein
MGQYGNQPDFGTKAANVVPTDVPEAAVTDLEKLNSAALYIGTGGTLVCSVVGGNAYSNGVGFTIFKNIPNGTFFPVIVNYVFQSDDNETLTTCSDIVALY